MKKQSLVKSWGTLLGGISSICFLSLSGIQVSAAGDVAIDATNFPDENFRKFVSENYDNNTDGVLSAEEIANVTEIVFGSGMYMESGSLQGIEFFTELKGLGCYNCNLSSLDLSHNVALEELTCSGNHLTTLDLSHNPALTLLFCQNNQLTSLDLQYNPLLTGVYCQRNQLTSINLQSNAALRNVHCYGNPLPKLDLSNNPSLVQVYYNDAKTRLELGNYARSWFFLAEPTYIISYDRGDGKLREWKPVFGEDAAAVTLPDPLDPVDILDYNDWTNFDKWDLGYPGDEIAVTDDTVLTALWKTEDTSDRKNPDTDESNENSNISAQNAGNSESTATDATNDIDDNDEDDDDEIPEAVAETATTETIAVATSPKTEEIHPLLMISYIGSICAGLSYIMLMKKKKH